MDAVVIRLHVGAMIIVLEIKLQQSLSNGPLFFVLKLTFSMRCLFSCVCVGGDRGDGQFSQIRGGELAGQAPARLLCQLRLLLHPGLVSFPNLPRSWYSILSLFTQEER